jgi:GTP-binding protein
MEIRSAIFRKSAAQLKDCPRPTLPEFAFIGRSNVGKSSLINSLCNNSGLAKTSGTPGKTQLINHFLVNEAWYIVDLPGYGYAKTGKGTRAIIEDRIREYCLKRETLNCLFVLLDSRLPLQQIDREFLAWCGANERPLSIVLTKADKLSKGELKRNSSAIEKALLEIWEELPNIFITSSKSKNGRDELLGFISHQLAEKKV